MAAHGIGGAYGNVIIYASHSETVIVYRVHVRIQDQVTIRCFNNRDTAIPDNKFIKLN